MLNNNIRTRYSADPRSNLLETRNMQRER